MNHMIQITKRVRERSVAVVVTGPAGTFEAAARMTDTHYAITAWPDCGDDTIPTRLQTRGSLLDAGDELERDLWKKAIDAGPVRGSRLDTWV